MFQSPSVPNLSLSGSPVLFYEKSGKRSRPQSSASTAANILRSSYNDLSTGYSYAGFPRIDQRRRPGSSNTIKSDPLPRENRSSLLRQKKIMNQLEQQKEIQLSTSKHKVKHKISPTYNVISPSKSPIYGNPMKAMICTNSSVCQHDCKCNGYDISPKDHLLHSKDSFGKMRALDIQRRRRPASPQLPRKTRNGYSNVYDFLQQTDQSEILGKNEINSKDLKLSVERLDDYSPKEISHHISHINGHSAKESMEKSAVHLEKHVPYENSLDQLPKYEVPNEIKEQETSGTNKVDKFFETSPIEKTNNELKADEAAAIKLQKFYRRESNRKRTTEKANQAATSIQRQYRRYRTIRDQTFNKENEDVHATNSEQNSNSIARQNSGSITRQNSVTRKNSITQQHSNSITRENPDSTTRRNSNSIKGQNSDSLENGSVPNHSTLSDHEISKPGPGEIDQTESMLDEFFEQDRLQRSRTNLKLDQSNRSDFIRTPKAPTTIKQSEIEASRKRQPMSRNGRSLRSSYGHFTQMDDPVKRHSIKSGPMTVENDDIIYDRNINEFGIHGRNIDQIYNLVHKRSPQFSERSESTAKPVEDASSLVSAGISSRTSNHQESSRAPSVSDIMNNSIERNEPEVSEILNFLENMSQDDDERISRISSRLSVRTNSTLKESDPVIIVEQVLAEKRILVQLCTKLLEYVGHTSRKVLEYESRQERKLQTILKDFNGEINEISDDTGNESKIEAEKGVLERLKAEHETQLADQKLIYENSIADLTDELDSIKIELLGLQNISETELVQSEDKAIETDVIFAGTSTDEQCQEILSETQALLSDHQELKSRMLNMTHEKEKTESALMQKQDEIDRLKKQIVQLAEEQSELNTQFGTRLTRKIDELESKNISLSDQLESVKEKYNLTQENSIHLENGEIKMKAE